MNTTSMIIISIIAGLLSSMNIWATKWTHVRLHLNDLYMACLMASWMVFFDSIYNQHHSNITILSILSIVLFIYLIRNQVFISDIQFMKGMIPHHSMAILMSEKIKNKSKNDNIIKLTNNIIKSQNDEIQYMEKLGY